MSARPDAPAEGVAGTAAGSSGSGLFAWVDRRIGIGPWARDVWRERRVAARPALWDRLGGLLVFLFLVQVTSGTLLLFYYVPEAGSAFESVRHLMRDVPFGWLIRLIHAHGANWMVAVAFAHLLAVAIQAGYKEPRELNWLAGCALFLLTLGAALTGYILPWSQLSYWATTIVTSAMAAMPVLGVEVQQWVRGGEWVGPESLRRAFAAHVALIPLATIGAVTLHVWLLSRTGLSEPPRRAAPRAPVRVPALALDYGVLIAGFLVLFFAGIVLWPQLVFPAESFLPADPLETPPHVKPEWYFLAGYQLLRMFPEPIALGLQGLAVLALVALPFVDRSPARHPLDRPWVVLAICVAFSTYVVLGLLGWRA